MMDKLRDTTPYQPDRTLANLFAAWWDSGDRDAALVLVDRLHELSSEQVAGVLMEFHKKVTTLPALAEVFQLIGASMAEAFRGLDAG
jgi:hypothetical protein